MIHARFATDIGPLLEEFGHATADAASETEAAIDRNNLVAPEVRQNADVSEAEGLAAATTASVIVHHVAAPDLHPVGAEQHKGEKEKVAVDQVAVEIVSSDRVTEQISDEDTSPSQSKRKMSNTFVICQASGVRVKMKSSILFQIPKTSSSLHVTSNSEEPCII